MSNNDFINGIDSGDAGASISAASGAIAADTAISGSVGYGYGTAAYDSADYYKLLVSTTGLASFKLGDKTSELYLRLINSNGSTLKTSFISGLTIGSIDYAIAPGTYYLEVDTPYTTSVSNSLYTLSIDLPETNGNDLIGTTSVGDAGASISTAAGAIATDTTISGSVGYGYNTSAYDSLDYYKLVVETTGLASFKLTNMTANLDLQLYNSAGSLIKWSYLAGSSDEAIDYAIAPGTYYLRVNNYQSADNSFYTLSVNLPETSGNDLIGATSVGDAGGSISTAAGSIATDTTITGSVGYGYNTSAYDSLDYYKLVVETTGLASFKLANMTANLDLQLYNSAGSLIKWSYLSGASDDAIDYAIAPGTYYLRVNNYQSTDNSFYTLSVNLPETSGNDLIGTTSVGDAGASISTAAGSITTDTTITGSVGYGYNTSSYDSLDYYKLIVETTGLASFKLTNMTANLDLQLYNSGGSLIKWSYLSGTNDDAIDYAITPGTYYLRVNNYQNTDYSFYNLSIDLPGTGTPTTSASVSISSTATSKSEGQSGLTPLTFNVNRDGDTSAAASVNWSVSGSGTSPANASDFSGGILPSGTVNFAAGETSKTITVNVVGDTLVEPDETFTVTLSNPVNLTLGSANKVTAQIINDDNTAGTPPSLAINPSNQPSAEGNAGSTAHTFTVTRSGDLSGTSSTAWSVTGSGNNPANSTDFVGGILPSGNVTFAAGQASATITVNVAGDTTIENNEGFVVTLADPVGATLSSSTTATSLNQSVSGGYGITEKFYTLGGAGGAFTMDYTMYTIPDRADIYVNNTLAISTNGSVSGSGKLTVPSAFNLQSGDVVRVVMTGTDTRTEWDYTVNYQGGLQSLNYIAAGIIIDDDQIKTPLSKLDDFVVLQPGSPNVIGAGSGNDTYLISGSMIPDGKSLTISDAIGNNSIQLAPGLSITTSQVTGNALKLNLSNGAAVTVLGADKFTYDVGGNTSAGRDNPDVSYQDFVTGTLGTSIPASGVATGSNRIIDSVTPASLLASTTTGDDFVALQYASPAVIGAGAGNDTYLIANDLLPAGTTLTISDAIGANSIQLAPGLTITSSQVASTALKLTLGTGATVTILGANNFTYDVGANTTAGINKPDVNFATFVQGTLGTTVPTSGVMNGGNVVIGGTTANTVTVQGNTTVNATANSDVFFFDAVTALLDTAGTNTQATISGFATNADTLRIDLPNANAAITNLSQLNGQQGVIVQTETINPRTLINFGNDANGGQAVSLILTGITDPALVSVQVV
jgi:hypothetical protein